MIKEDNKGAGVRQNRLPVVDQLTPVESKIWEMHQAGKKKDEIAAEMGIAVKSVERRIYTAKQKVFLR